MTGVLLVIALIVLIKLVLIASVTPVDSSYSRFELERRKTKGSPGVGLEQLRASSYSDIVSIQRVLQAILLVAFVLIIVAALGWFVGSVVAVIVALEYGALARVTPIASLGNRMYQKYEQVLLTFVDRHASYVRWMRSAVPTSTDNRIDSKDELTHMIAESGHVISDREKNLITASLRFDEKRVSEVMTPKSVVDTIKKSEMLGPLVLDDLHKTGHSRFPVIDEDIDHVVGILHVKSILTLDTSRKHTAKVETAMSKQVFYIRDDHNLDQALTAFLSTHSHLFIVINEFRETVGILTLEDTIEALIGRKIIDEFDAHDDMRAVAARQAASHGSINRSPESKDI